MESWKGLIIAFALVALFSLSIFNFAVYMQVNNGANQTIINDPILSAFNRTVYSNLSGLNSKTEVFQNASDSDQKEEQIYAGEISLGSIFTSLSTFTGFVITLFGSLLKLLTYLGISPIVVAVLLSILVIVNILLFWKLWKQGA